MNNENREIFSKNRKILIENLENRKILIENLDDVKYCVMELLMINDRNCFEGRRGDLSDQYALIVGNNALTRLNRLKYIIEKEF